VQVAVLPDAHLARDVCVGVAVATRNRIYPAAVGGDIGCGMTSVPLGTSAAPLTEERPARDVLARLARAIPVLRHRGRPDQRLLPGGLEETPLSSPKLESLKRRTGRLQIGTVGRGNHFVELQVDGDDELWLTVHSGSRSLGVAIRDHHVSAADVDATARLRYFDADSPAGRAYLADQAFALRYADANRHAIARAAADVLVEIVDAAPDWGAAVSCHHNFVRSEFHGGSLSPHGAGTDAPADSRLWVHRKGAISAADGEAGIIPGSMGTPTYLTRGRGCRESLCTSSHGAGRRLSRTEARRRIGARELARDMRGIWFDERRVHHLRDEAPAAYRDIDKVMRAQRALTRIERRLRPLLSFKGT
jgi:tRNA-splicing ligase RtcB